MERAVFLLQRLDRRDRLVDHLIRILHPGDVERIEQVDYLREQDCDEVQGHWLAYPLPPDQCLAFLRERAARRRSTLDQQG